MINALCIRMRGDQPESPERFEEEKIGEIYLVYTSLQTRVHEPKLLKLLPVEFSDKELSDAERNTPMNYKPGEEEAWI